MEWIYQEFKGGAGGGGRKGKRSVNEILGIQNRGSSGNRASHN